MDIYKKACQKLVFWVSRSFAVLSKNDNFKNLQYLRTQLEGIFLKKLLDLLNLSYTAYGLFYMGTSLKKGEVSSYIYFFFNLKFIIIKFIIIFSKQFYFLSIGNALPVKISHFSWRSRFLFSHWSLFNFLNFIKTRPNMTRPKVGQLSERFVTFEVSNS